MLQSFLFVIFLASALDARCHYLAGSPSSSNAEVRPYVKPINLDLIWGRSCALGSSHRKQSYFERLTNNRSPCRDFDLHLRGGYDDGFRQGTPTAMAVKRIKGEIAALEKDKSDFFRAQPLEVDLLDWHFVLLGSEGTCFEGGVYHGRILLDQDYPMKPPRIMFLTPSGRFQVGEPICLSMTSHHQETWQPSWDVRTALTAIRGFMNTDAEGALGGIDMDEDSRQYLAREDVCEAAGIKPITTLRRMTPTFSTFLLGHISWLLQQASWKLLYLASMFGYINLRDFSAVVEGFCEKSIAGCIDERLSKRLKAAEQQTTCWKEQNLILERNLQYKEQQLLKALAEKEEADEKRAAAEQEVADAGNHIESLLASLSERDAFLGELVEKGKIISKQTEVESEDDIGELNEKEDNLSGVTATEAEKMLDQLANGEPLSESELQTRLQQAKSWAAQGLQRAANAEKESVETKKQKEARERKRSVLQSKAVENEYTGLKRGFMF